VRLATNIPYRGWLLGVFLVLLPLSCINAASPPDLVLQHTPTVLLIAVLIGTGIRHPLSNLSYTLCFVYLLLHLVGARHLYSFVPYDNWTEQLLGVRLADMFGFQRNHYDRLVHLCFGLLLMYPAHEVVVRLMKIGGGWSLVVAAWLIIVFSTVYELLEWMVAMVMEPGATERYNGQQGDMWDAHRDTALAMGGAVFSASLLGLVKWSRATRDHRMKPSGGMA
jgi:putative membrane protein